MITVQLGQTTVPTIGVGTWNIGEEPAKHAEVGKDRNNQFALA